MKNLFKIENCEDIIIRINNLKEDSQPLWGKMNVAQMLAHCNVTYDMVYENMYPKPGFLVRLLLKSFVKSKVVSEQPYEKNGPTAPAFKVDVKQDFDKERRKLIEYIIKTQDLGPNEFEGKESLSFGKLTANEWNNMFSKHLDHHLNQFGV